MDGGWIWFVTMFFRPTSKAQRPKSTFLNEVPEVVSSRDFLFDVEAA
jgi:hypothetical protein